MNPLHWSQLRHMAKSPAHYRYFLDHPVEETAAMRIGSQADALLFGSPRRYVVWPERRAGKAWEQFQADNQDATILNLREYECAEAAAESLRKNPEAMDRLVGHCQRTIRWAINGRECEGTPDAVPISGLWLSDLKVTADANPEWFWRHAARQGWLGQSAWYADGLRSAVLGDPKRHFIVAVEAKPPHVVQVFELTEAAVESGRRLYRLLFERLLVHEASDHWPGYQEGVAVLDVPEELTLTIDGEEVAA